MQLCYKLSLLQSWMIEREREMYNQIKWRIGLTFNPQVVEKSVWPPGQYTIECVTFSFERTREKERMKAKKDTFKSGKSNHQLIDWSTPKDDWMRNVAKWEWKKNI